MPNNDLNPEVLGTTRPTSNRQAELELARNKIRQLVDVFHANHDRFTSSDYSEAQARIDFIDKFWIALGWDVNHERQTNPYEQEVKVERGVPISGRGRRADYAFLAPNFRDVRFFVEAKRPGQDPDNADDYFQLIRYGWNSHAQLSVLTSFEHFRVVDCRYRPDIDSALLHNITDLSFHYSQYPDADAFARIFYLFSREAVAGGSLERYVQDLPKPAGRAVQRGLFPSGRLQPVDESFLQELDEFRVDLAKAFKSSNLRLDSEELTETTQRTLDRLVFMRFLEDKLIEADPIVEGLGARGDVWGDFISASRRLDRLPTLAEFSRVPAFTLPKTTNGPSFAFGVAHCCSITKEAPPLASRASNFGPLSKPWSKCPRKQTSQEARRPGCTNFG